MHMHSPCIAVWHFGCRREGRRRADMGKEKRKREPEAEAAEYVPGPVSRVMTKSGMLKCGEPGCAGASGRTRKPPWRRCLLAGTQRRTAGCAMRGAA